MNVIRRTSKENVLQDDLKELLSRRCRIVAVVPDKFELGILRFDGHVLEYRIYYTQEER